MTTFRSDISKIEYPATEKVSARTIRHSVLNLIQKDHPHFTHDSFLSQSELSLYREKAISDFLVKELGELTELDKTVLDSLTGNTILTDKLDGESQQALTFGQRVADKVAAFGGSWTFIISFAVFIALWISANVYWLANKGFDPYPFILLNLILSCLAALQAPVIMMSQNRQESKDRARAQNDYQVNLKAEIEIRQLHEKIDHILISQSKKLFEIQEIQIELMEQMMTKK